jgi:hypothetical protein
VARIYAQCVGLLVLPLLLFLWCLEYIGRTPLSHGSSFIDQTLDSLRLLSAWASLWSNADQKHSLWSNWGSIVGLLAFGFVFFGVADSWYERSARNLVASIAAMLDKSDSAGAPASSRWKSSFVEISARGTLEGRAVTVSLRASYAQRFNYNRLRIGLACRSPWPFQVEPRSAVERLVERWEDKSPGTTELDESLSLVSDAPSFYRWIAQPSVSQQVRALIARYHLASIEADPQTLPGVLRFSYAQVQVFSRGRLLHDMPGALREMEKFAAAVENHSAAEAKPASSYPRQADVDQAPQAPSALAGGIRLKGLILMMLGIALLSGVPSSLVSTMFAPRDLYSAWLAMMLPPWLGIAMLVAGAVLHRRSRARG